jgi:hypothetical protein
VSLRLPTYQAACNSEFARTQQSRDPKPALAIAPVARNRSASRNEYSFFCANFADGAIPFAYCNMPLMGGPVELIRYLPRASVTRGLDPRLSG